MNRRPGSLSARISALFVALALCVRIAVPQGFMLAAPAEGGAPAMVMCPGQGAMPMAAMPGKHDRHDKKASDSCPFDVAGLALDTRADAVFAYKSAALETASNETTAAASPGRGLAAPPPPSTGPPAFA